MRRVLKWQVELIDAPQQIGGGPVVLVEPQRDAQDFCVWTLESSAEPALTRTVRVFGTGHEIPDGWEWIGSLQMWPFVWHVFEEVQF